ncbi:MAG: OmpA family protein [Xanthobacteraceae bacterium]|nr:OmpA family protein [Xanthobacteraceae bacterium]
MRSVSKAERYRHMLLATTVVSAIALPQIVSAFDGTSAGDGRIIVAQKEDPKKKKEAAPPPKAPPPPPQKQVQPPKAPPPPPQKQVQPPPQQQQQQKFQQQKQVQPPPGQQQKFQQQQQKQVQPPPGQQKFQQQQKQVQPPPGQQQKFQQQQKQVQPPPGQQQKLQPEQKQVQPPPGQQQKLQPEQKQVQPPPGQQQKLQPEQKQVQPPPGQQQKLQPEQKQVQPPPGQQQKLQPEQKQVQPPPGQQPQFQPKQVQPQQGQQPQLQPKQVQQPPVQIQKFGAPKAPPPQVGNVNELKGKRREERVGNTVVIVEPGNRRIFRDGNRVFIRHDEGERMRRWGNARFETRGNERYTIVNRGGYDVVTITDGRGHLLRRYRRFPDGREYALIDNRRRWGTAAVVGGVVVGGAVIAGLMMPRIAIPREQYIVEMDTAPPAYLYEALEAPPLVAMERPYTLDEVRDNYELRARVRSVDVNTINFATGSWEVSPDQIPRLQGLAEAMLKVIGENPATVFLIEGHTDAVGAAEDNMSLSDRRAEAVAEVLTTHFNIPPENLVTQGYGEQHLRVQTDGPSRENRRVEVRNVTGLMAAGQGDQDGPPGGPPPQGQPPG